MTAYVRVNLTAKTADRTKLPSFLVGLLPESLVDLSWTAKELDVRHLAWWPERPINIDFDPLTSAQDGEILTPLWDERVVEVRPRIVALSPEVIAAKRAEIEAQMLKAYEQAAVAYLDSNAKALGYDDIKSAVGYAEEPAVPKFQADGIKLRRLRSLVWERCYALYEEVKAGQRTPPTLEEFPSLLPKLGD